MGTESRVSLKEAYLILRSPGATEQVPVRRVVQASQVFLCKKAPLGTSLKITTPSIFTSVKKNMYLTNSHRQCLGL